MPAQRIASQTIPRHTVQALEALAHVRGSGSQVDSRCSPKAEHAQIPSSTRTNCSSAPVSNPRPTSIRRPNRSTTANALPVAATGAGTRPDTSTASNALLPARACRFRRVRYRPRVLNASPRCRQNSFRFNPLDSNSATNCSTSCRLRRRRTTHTCSSFMLLLHHSIHYSNRWFPLTLTFQTASFKSLYRKRSGDQNLFPHSSLAAPERFRYSSKTCGTLLLSEQHENIVDVQKHLGH